MLQEGDPSLLVGEAVAMFPIAMVLLLSYKLT
jgi:hypothetical protein